MLRSILVLIDTQGWQKSGSESDDDDESLGEIKWAIEYIASVFREPLEAKDVNIAAFQYEIDEVVGYSRRYLPIQRESYRKIWYKIHNSHDANKWPTILLLCELLFSFPFSSGHVERLFSSLKLIKTNNLQASTLGDLLEIHVEGPPLKKFSPDNAIEAWWSATTRRPNQTSSRKIYRPRQSSSTSDSVETKSDLVWKTVFR